MLITGCLSQNVVNVGICFHPNLFYNSCAQHWKINNMELQYPFDIWFIKSQLKLQNKGNHILFKKGTSNNISCKNVLWSLARVVHPDCLDEKNDFPPTRVEHGPMCYWMKLAWLQPSWHLNYAGWENPINYTSMIPWSFNINKSMPSERNLTKKCNFLEETATSYQTSSK